MLIKCCSKGVNKGSILECTDEGKNDKGEEPPVTEGIPFKMTP